MPILWKLFLAAAIVIALALALAACSVKTPFRGPGFEPERGVTLPDAGDEVVVQITHARLDRALRSAFDEQTRRVVEDLPKHPGLIGFSVRRELLGDDVWTLSVWRDEPALEDFIRSTTHRRARSEGSSATLESNFRRVPWPTRLVPPSWDQALELLAETRGSTPR
ncbi:MAG: antibiotic biosynthesis monooxygenase [Planctomycetota bacterium]|nr:antibiotic biosynthesis monooxygenase [Planctomycetota bacterium]